LSTPICAFLDLGTNTFHLLIFQSDFQGGWEKVLHRRITVKLGQGGIHRNEIASVPYRRGMHALKLFRGYIDDYRVRNIRAFGTASLRNASNGKQFIREANSRYKIPINLISGEEEAKLILKGVRQAVDLSNRTSLVMDIGGGSVEFIIANDKKVFFKKSFKLGAALLLEQFNPEDPIKKVTLSSMQKQLALVLQPLFTAISIHQPVSLIGSAGSFESFASMISYLFPESGSHYGKKSYPILFKHYRKLHKLLINSTKAERKQMRGLINMRVDMIVMASVLTNFVLKESGIKKIVMSSYALKEGAALDMIMQT